MLNWKVAIFSELITTSSYQLMTVNFAEFMICNLHMQVSFLARLPHLSVQFIHYHLNLLDRRQSEGIKRALLRGNLTCCQHLSCQCVKRVFVVTLEMTFTFMVPRWWTLLTLWLYLKCPQVQNFNSCNTWFMIIYRRSWRHSSKFFFV